MLDELDIEKYKSHPRVLEIRFILLFDLIEKELGLVQTMNLYQGLCSAFHLNFSFINAIINKRFDIKRSSKRAYKRWRQEVVFAAYVYGESVYKIANTYLHVNTATLYNQKDIYDINNFLDEEWLEKLGGDVCLCGIEAYRNEVLRFNEIIDGMSNILTKWKGGK